MSKDNRGYIRGVDRDQFELLPPCVEDYVAPASPVRFIDAFVEHLDLGELEFSHHQAAATGRPAYDPRLLLGLYIYGYLHRLTSSRRLEAECKRNLEVMWLMRRLQPDFKTLARFRSENSSSLHRVFQAFTSFCREQKMFSREVVAIDGSKFKAVNSQDQYLKLANITKAQEKTDARIAEYLEALARADEEEEACPTPTLTKEELQDKIERFKQRQTKLKQQEELLAEQGVEEYAVTDPDSVRLTDRKHRHGVVGYNVQIAVDTQSHMIVALDAVTDKNDLNQLSAMARQAQDALGIVPEDDDKEGEAKKRLTVLADAGYHEADELEACEEQRITAVVPAPRTTSGRSATGEEIFPVEAFVYDQERNCYVCPEGQELARQGVSLQKGIAKASYSNPQACAVCPLKEYCTTGAARKLWRRFNQAAVERAAQCYKGHRELFKQRKSTVEHVFGTFRNRGQGAFLQRGKTKILGELSLSALAYNITRAINLKGVTALIQAVKA